jgi:hypothetical protein
MIHKSAAYDFIVGGQKGWSVPSDSNNPFNQWAEKSRFQVGDSLGKFFFNLLLFISYSIVEVFSIISKFNDTFSLGLYN